MEPRLTVLSDAPILAALHAESFGASAWSPDQIARSLSLPTTRCWLAVSGYTPQGFIMCQSSGDETDILTFCVSPAQRRAGVGRRLLDTAVEDATRRKMRRIFLEVAVDNAAALSIYKKAGFSTTGIRKNYYWRGAARIDAAMLELLIGDAL